MPLAHAAVARNINIVVVVKNFSDGTVIEIDRGRFDDWCIYITGTCDRYSPAAAASFSRGLPWTRIDNECKLRGF